MLDVLFVYFYVCPDMVLNHRQVLVIVSDWEPYLGSLFCVGFCGWWSPVSVFVPHGTVSGFHSSWFCSLFMYGFFIKEP